MNSAFGRENVLRWDDVKRNIWNLEWIQLEWGRELLSNGIYV
jgi:hypothetical protein